MCMLHAYHSYQVTRVSVNAGLARSIGPHAAALADLVKDTPSGSEKLLLQMLTVLTGKTTLLFALLPTCL